jgi:bifunctional ADP-heptose synthase (sugar kinase/adenylyltransferase)
LVPEKSLDVALLLPCPDLCTNATSNQEVFDVQGAGDTTIAVLALARAAAGAVWSKPPCWPMQRQVW